MDKIQLQKQCQAGHLAYTIFENLKGQIKPGVNLLSIEKFVHEEIVKNGFKPAFLGYKGYPAATCLSVNEEIVHGIPKDRILDEGDVVKVDLGITNAGFIIDTARTYGVGRISQRNQQLLDATEFALEQAIQLCRPGNRTGDIGETIEKIIKGAGFSVIEELAGHGVGKTLQEPPSVPNYGKKGTGTVLTDGMVIAVEPITSTNPTKVGVLSDGWTIVATTEAVTAQFEHTIAITNDGPVVLTRP